MTFTQVEKSIFADWISLKLNVGFIFFRKLNDEIINPINYDIYKGES